MYTSFKKIGGIKIMLYVTLLEALPGKVEELVSLAKNPQPPAGVKIVNVFGLFGKPDCILIFEALDEKIATDFIFQFDKSATTRTSLAVSLEKL